MYELSTTLLYDCLLYTRDCFVYAGCSVSHFDYEAAAQDVNTNAATSTATTTYVYESHQCVVVIQ